jgi:hypothetical protein
MKKLVLLFLSISFFSSLSFGEEFKLTKDEFLKKLEMGTVTMSKDPLFPGLSEGMKNGAAEMYKAKYPNFQSAYLFVPTVRTNKYCYSVVYEWPLHKCVFRIDTVSKDPKKPIKREDVDIEGTVVDKKYCEMAYGIKITY